MVLLLVFAQLLADLFLPTLMADIIDNGVVTGDTGYIWRMGGRVSSSLTGYRPSKMQIWFWSWTKAKSLSKERMNRFLKRVVFMKNFTIVSSLKKKSYNWNIGFRAMWLGKRRTNMSFVRFFILCNNYKSVKIKKRDKKWRNNYG